MAVSAPGLGKSDLELLVVLLNLWRAGQAIRLSMARLRARYGQGTGVGGVMRSEMGGTAVNAARNKLA